MRTLSRYTLWMHTVEKGDLSVAMLTAAFLQRRFVVLKPISELSRYDLVIDRGQGFERVQCKTGRIKSGAVRFNAASSQYHHGNGIGRTSYRGSIDLFGVYCPESGVSYLVPVADVGEVEGVLRVDAPKNGQSAGIRLAARYELPPLA